GPAAPPGHRVPLAGARTRPGGVPSRPRTAWARRALLALRGPGRAVQPSRRRAAAQHGRLGGEGARYAARAPAEAVRRPRPGGRATPGPKTRTPAPPRGDP